ncbi:hypothetical protein T484DRAFT_1758454, partial [Baffinella frigidus]
VAAAFPWTTAQQNDEFLALVGAKPPVGINIFSHYDAVSGKVPDARGNGYDVTATKTITVDVIIANRIYPPTNMVNWFSESRSLYYAKFTLTGQSYGNGGYTVRASNMYGDPFYGYGPWKVFGYSPWNQHVGRANTYGAHWKIHEYSSGVYQKSASLDGTYKGDWVTIKHPAPFVLKSFQFVPNYEGEMSNMPGKFKIYGRNDDGDLWTLLYTQSAVPSTFSTNAIYYTTTTLPYSEYGMVVGQLRGDSAHSDNHLTFRYFNMWGHPTPTVAITTTAATQLSIETEPGTGGFNAVNPIASLYGEPHIQLSWPAPLAATFTVCWATRYHSATSTNARILETTTGNSLLGHADGKRGKLLHNGQWYMYNGVIPDAPATDWLVACFTNGRTDPSGYVIDQTDWGDSNTETTQPSLTLGVNHNNYPGPQNGDFNIHSVYVWDDELSNTEMKVVTRALRKEL